MIKVISDLCHFFKVLCGKVLDLSELDKLEEEVVMTLCELEKMFLYNHGSFDNSLNSRGQARWFRSLPLDVSH